MPVTFRPAARRDVLQQFQYYLEEIADPQLAGRFLTAVEASVARVGEHPAIGSPQALKHPALERLRAWPVAGFDEILLYYIERADGPEIVRVLHSKRDVLRLLLTEEL